MGRNDNSSRRSRGRSSGRSRGDPGGESGGDGIPASGLLDLFTDVDDILREVNDTLQGLSANQAAVGELLADLTNREIDLPSRVDRPLVSAEVVEATGEVVTDEIAVPKDGILSEVALVWPEGSNQSVGIGVVGVDDESLVPFGPQGHRFIALNDTTKEFNLDYPVSKGETLTVRYVNNRNVDEDAYPSAILTVTEER